MRPQAITRNRPVSVATGRTALRARHSGGGATLAGAAPAAQAGTADTMCKIAFSTLPLKNKIPAGDPLWPKHTASFVNEDLETLDIATKIFGGKSFTTWHKNNWRDASNYLLGQHIGLDFDTEDERSSLNWLSRELFIAKYGAFCYTTPSHTPQAPRARVVFLLDTPIYQPQNYILAASAMTWLFSHADSKCKDPARFFYGSLECDVAYLDHVLPLEVVKGIIAKYQRTGQQEKRRHVERATDDVSAAKLVASTIRLASQGERNDLGYWLACRLAETGIPQHEAQKYVLDYQQAVEHMGTQNYVEAEALNSLRSAYRAAL
jgi:hypothetical protein